MATVEQAAAKVVEQAAVQADLNSYAGMFMEVIGIFLLAMLTWLLWSAHRSQTNKIDMSFLLIDTQTGNVTLAKFGGLLALFVSTWVFLYLPVAGHFDSTYAVGYIATWGAIKVASDITNKPKDQDGNDRGTGVRPQQPGGSGETGGDGSAGSRAARTTFAEG